MISNNYRLEPMVGLVIPIKNNMKNLLIKIINRIKMARTARGKDSDNPAVSVPEIVTVSFWSMYPQARLKKWRNEHDIFVASFAIRANQYEVFYSGDGRWRKTEMKIPLTRGLPPAINHSFKKSEFVDWNITELKKLELSGEHLYIVRVENTMLQDKKQYIIPMANLLYFSADGRLLNIEKCGLALNRM